MKSKEWDAIGECFAAWAAELKSGTYSIRIAEDEAGIMFFLRWDLTIDGEKRFNQRPITMLELMECKISPSELGASMRR